MRRRLLGTTGFEISTIGFGTWVTGGHLWGGQDDAESVAAMEAAIDHGVNWIDTAPIYGSGHSEEVVGRALRQMASARRPYVFTKFGLGQDSANIVRKAGRADVMAECEASLRRLGVDVIDLYQMHWPVEGQPVAETAAACADLLAAGKIRAIGVSNFSVAQLEEWLATGVPLHTLQAPFSVLRPAVASSQLPWCEAHGLGVVAYSPLLRGMLFGTWGRDKSFPPDDGRASHKDYSGARFERHLDALDELKALAASAALSCGQLCVGVLLQTPGLTGCIVGARNARQGSLIAGLDAGVTAAQADQVWRIVGRLQKDLEGM